MDVVAVLAELGIEARVDKGRAHATCPSPKHDDAKPSWAMSLEHPHPHGCWSCPYTGTLVSLVHDVLRLDWSQAEQWVRERANRSGPTRLRTNVIPPGPRPFDMPSGFVQRPMHAWPSPARDYARSRGITPEQVERWGIGYAAYGKLEGRVVIPVHDDRGRIATYAARTFLGAEPRFMNGSRAEGARSDAVFGEWRWSRDGACVALAEGPIDALALERAGAVDVAAFCGTKPSPVQIAKLSRFRRVLAFLDVDQAGDACEAELVRVLGPERVVRVRLEPVDGRRVDPASCDACELARVVASQVASRPAPSSMRVRVTTVARS